MIKRKIDRETRTNTYKMTLQPQLLKPKDLKILNKMIVPLLRKQGIELKDVAESFKSLLHPLRIEKIKEHRPFYLNMKGGYHTKRPLKLLITPNPKK